MPISYDLDLNLPTDPGLPPGEAYDEFRRIYAALRQLQDGIGEAAGLINFSSGGSLNENPLQLYGFSRATVLVFTAQTDIVLGELCQIGAFSGQARMFQPISYIFSERSLIEATRFSFMPLNACTAGQKVAVTYMGGIAPKPGATVGSSYCLSSGKLVVPYTSSEPPQFYTSANLDASMIVGQCLVAGTILTSFSLRQARS